MALSSSRGSEEDGITTTRQVNGVFRDQLLSSYGRERRHTEGAFFNETRRRTAQKCLT